MCLARLVLLSSLFLACGSAAGQVLEHQVKAAFLFRFLSFVEWPEQALGAPGAPLVIAVLGAEDLRSELQNIVSGRMVNNRPVVVESLREGERPRGAHVLFVARDARAQLRRLATIPALLLVGESHGALEQGALINFVVRDDRVRFEVAPEEAERRGLRIGARVLALALHVKAGAPKP
jgi:hypothetical protein